MDEDKLKQLVNEGLSSRRIAKSIGCSQSTIRHYLKKFNLKTGLIGSRESLDGSERTCSCGRKFIYTRKSGHRLNTCNSCGHNNEKRKIRYQKRKIEYVEYKGGKCERCGYDRCVRALTFHHLDRNQKEFEISFARGKTWETVKAELDKCVLLCFNCHMEERDDLGTTRTVTQR